MDMMSSFNAERFHFFEFSSYLILILILILILNLNRICISLDRFPQGQTRSESCRICGIFVYAVAHWRQARVVTGSLHVPFSTCRHLVIDVLYLPCLTSCFISRDRGGFFCPAILVPDSHFIVVLRTHLHFFYLMQSISSLLFHHGIWCACRIKFSLFCNGTRSYFILVILRNQKITAAISHQKGLRTARLLLSQWQNCSNRLRLRSIRRRLALLRRQYDMSG